MGIFDFFQKKIRHFDKEKYFKYREKVIDPSVKGIKKYIYFYACKKMEAYNCASLGTGLNYGATYASIPKLPHGLNGIIINPYSKIGKNCTIFHQVTIGNDYKDVKNAPIIGDDVFIGAGAKIIGKITIGNNVKIGAGAVVVTDIPDNATVVMDKPRIIIKSKGDKQ